MARLTDVMILALSDLPIEHHSANEGWDEEARMVWLGQSNREYQFRTLEALEKRGLVKQEKNGINRFIKL